MRIVTGLLLLIGSWASAHAQTVKAIAGPKGIWITLGKDLPRGFEYKILRSEADNVRETEEVGRVKIPASQEELQGRIFEIMGLNIGFSESITDREARFLFKECRAGRNDSLLFFMENLPVLYSVGLAWYDAKASAGISYKYQIVRSDASAPAVSFNAEFPGNKPASSFVPVSATGGAGGVTLVYKVAERAGLARVKVYRAYYMRSGYEEIRPNVIFYTQNEALMVSVMDKTAQEKVPYIYRIVPVDLAGNTGNPSPELSLFSRKEKSIAPSVDRLMTASEEKENAIRVSWILKEVRDIVSIEVYRSRVHNGKYYRVASLPPSDTAWWDYDVQPVETYFYTVQLNGAYEQSPNSVRVSGMLRANQPNLFPVNNLLAGQNGNVVSLSWDRAEKDTRAYHIYRANGFTGELRKLKQIVVSDSGRVSALDTLPETDDDQVYSYAIRDENTSYALGPFSDRVNAYGKGGRHLEAPNQPGVRVLRPGVVQLIWADQSAGNPAVAGYVVYRRAVDAEGNEVSARKEIGRVPAEINTWLDSGIQAGSQYLYSLSALDQMKGEPGKAGMEGIYDYPLQALAGVSDLKVFASAAGVELQWSNPAGVSLSSIRVLRAEPGKEPAQITELESDGESWTDTKVAAGKQYFYYITTVFKGGKEGRTAGPVGVHLR
ncbi:MAG: hypothetical protein JNL57_03440 [Bacteroidetes bacterium]|nr:hypothetical protein [Bacteroidota bacterium]